jgi:hypothetical protein
MAHNPSGRNLHKQNNAQTPCRPVTVLSYLEAENVRLRQTVAELSLDTSILREVLARRATTPDGAALVETEVPRARVPTTPIPWGKAAPGFGQPVAPLMREVGLDAGDGAAKAQPEDRKPLVVAETG